MLRTLRFSQLRFRRNVPPCGGMGATLIFRRFKVPAARRRPTFRRWITPGYDPGRDSFFYFFFFYFLTRPSGAAATAATIKPRQRSGATPRPSGVRSYIESNIAAGRRSAVAFSTRLISVIPDSTRQVNKPLALPPRISDASESPTIAVLAASSGLT